MQYTTVIVTNMIASKAAFAVREDTGEQVYIPASVSRAVELSVIDVVLAKIVPNRDHHGQINGQVPWLAAIVSRSNEDFIPPEEVEDALDKFDYPVTAEEAGVPLMALQNAHHYGKAVKVVVIPNPKADKVIMWAKDVDRV